MRIGLIGTGRIGGFHAETMRAVDGVDAVLVADADAGRARAMAETAGLQAVPDVDALYAEGIDGVVVTAATSAHAALVHQALEHGSPCSARSRSPSTSPARVEVVAHAEASGVPVQVGFQRRFDARLPGRQGRRWRPATSAGCTACGR